MKRRSPVDQTPMGKRILAIVCQFPGSTTTQIGELAEANPVMTRRFLDRLSGEGFVYKRGDINLLRWYPKKMKEENQEEGDRS